MSQMTETEEFGSWERGAQMSGLSIGTLKRLARDGKLRVFRPSPGRVLLSLRELREFIESSAQSSAGRCR